MKSLFYVFSLAFLYSANDKFYTFNMGQGSCNVFVPGNPAVPVVLFDCGSHNGLPVNIAQYNYNNVLKFSNQDALLPIQKIANVINNAKQLDIKVFISHADKDHESSINAVITKLNNNCNNYVFSYYCGGNSYIYNKYPNAQTNCGQMQVFSNYDYSYNIISTNNGTSTNTSSLIVKIVTPT